MKKITMKKFTVRDVVSVHLLSASPFVVSVDGNSYTSCQLRRAFTPAAISKIKSILSAQQESAKAAIAGSYADVKQWAER